MFELNHGVIISCDVKTLEDLQKLVESTSSVHGVVGYKVGFILGLGFGLKNVVDFIREISDLPVIYDHQKAGTDIPQMGAEFAAVMKHAGVNSAIIFPQAGPKTQQAFIESLLAKGVVPMVGGDMTHECYLEKDGGYISNASPERMYKNGAESGAEFFIVPGNNPASVKKYEEMLARIIEPKFCMPGIGRQGGDINNAFEACDCPAYAIIGSAIYNAPDISAAAKKFCDEAVKFE